jgi:hypothetical protein
MNAAFLSIAVLFALFGAGWLAEMLWRKASLAELLCFVGYWAVAAWFLRQLWSG